MRRRRHRQPNRFNLPASTATTADARPQPLRQRLGFNRLMRSAALEPPVRLDDRRQTIIVHLRFGERQALQRSSRWG